MTIKEQLRIKQTGEVFTPRSLIREMLDRLPNEVWFDPNKRWLEPAAGDGNFLVEIKARLLQAGHDEIHILENMLFSVELIDDNHWALQHRLGYLIDGQPNPALNPDHFTISKISQLTQDLNDKNPYTTIGCERDEVVHHRNHVCASGLDYDFSFGRTEDVKTNLPLLPVRDLGPWPETDTPDVGERYVVEKMLGRQPNLSNRMQANVEGYNTLTSVDDDMHIAPSQLRKNFAKQIDKLNCVQSYADPFHLGNEGVYLQIFVAGTTKKFAIGRSGDIKSRHTSKLKDIRSAGGKSSEPHHVLSDYLVDPSNPIDSWHFHTVPISNKNSPGVEYALNELCKAEGLDVLTNVSATTPTEDECDEALSAYERIKQVLANPSILEKVNKRKTKTPRQPGESAAGGWQVKAEWIGKGLKIRCKSPVDGSFWECDHDALVAEINASLKAKGKPLIGEPGPSEKSYGSSTGLRCPQLWTRV